MSSAPSDEAAEARELDEFFRQQDPVHVAAVDWHTRREQGLTVAEQGEFRQWLAANPAHAAAFEGLDSGVATLRALSAEDTKRVHAGRKRAKGVNSSWFSFAASAPRRSLLAFCCTAFLAMGLGWYHWNWQRVFSENYAIARGQRQTATLPDGTELTLDADTQANVVLYRDRREVRLKEGQVMLAVAPDPEKPFQVLAGRARITVVGTRFSVRYRHTGRDSNIVKVAVEEGHVRVANTGGWLGGSSDAAIDLVAGQEMTVSENGAIGPVSKVAPGSIALWRKGMVRFENTPLGEALLEMEHYGATDLVIHDPTVAAMPIGGSFHIGSPERFARMVTQILPVRLVRNSAGQTEIARAP